MQRRCLDMKKRQKTGGEGNMDIKDLAWRNFVESGEIGAYMFYKKISEENNDRTKDAGDSAKSD